MPCALCRTHYKTWCKKTGASHPISAIQGRGEEFRVAARTWLWELHEEVNNSRGISMGTRPPLSEMPALYGSRTTEALDADVQLFFTVLKEAALIHQVDGAAVRQFRASLGLLRKLIGI